MYTIKCNTCGTKVTTEEIWSKDSEIDLITTDLSYKFHCFNCNKGYGEAMSQTKQEEMREGRYNK